MPTSTALVLKLVCDSGQQIFQDNKLSQVYNATHATQAILATQAIQGIHVSKAS